MDKKESSIKYAKELLSLKARAINNLSELLNEEFDNAVNKILDISKSGHIVVSGIGKAGFVGMKISATLASTGVPSFFLHPGEASHGDLGRYTEKDLALILSNSGETEEILNIISSIKRIGCPIISITSKKDSNLAKHSDIHIDIGAQDEVGPLGLAPTTSTTAMLVMGDALAMSVLEKQNFTKEQFAFYHPGGSLGRSLMHVSQIMRKGEENCIVKDDIKTKDVISLITNTKGRPGAAAVIDQNNKLIGIFTDGNLRRCLDKGSDFLDLPIKSVMSENPKSIKSDMVLSEVLRFFSKNKVDQLIVINDNSEPIGLVDIQDLVAVKMLSNR
ncbi:UNVERIFIED_CONTAM: hypothetical protein GTU68_063314 [Idotea baltica]|nr:hypothetical protein [Idotea baltica]